MLWLIVDHASLHLVRCSLFVVYCSVCLMLVVYVLVILWCCLLFVVCVSRDDCCSLFVLCCFLVFVGACWVFVV